MLNLKRIFPDFGLQVKKELEELKILEAKNLVNNFRNLKKIKNFEDIEFKVFSQFGDDGIIQYLIHNLDIDTQIFIEFGVEDYTEANTRFLLINNNWKGLIIDCDKGYIDKIKNEEVYWKYDLTAACSFVTCENINHIFESNGFAGEVGILSIDIDGNDYWVWESIKAVSPIVVIVEYNSVFGSDFALTVPYSPKFHRTNAHFSNLYWGCSLKALTHLGRKKGYYFIGSNSNGNNAYFVRKDKIGKMKRQTIKSGYVLSKFRESRDKKGRLSYISGKERLKVIQNMPIVDVEKNKQLFLKDVLAI